MSEATFSQAAHAQAMRAGGFWKDRQFDEFLLASARTSPEKPAIVADSGGGQKRISWRELEDMTARAAASLRGLGLQRGDIIAMQSPTWWEAVVLTLACLRTGVVINPLMPIFREHELTFMLGFAEAKAFVVPKTYANFDFEGMANDLKAKLPALQHVIVMRGDGPDAFDTALLGGGDRLQADSPGADAAGTADALSVLMYTSGTTGSPKGVMHTANTLMCCVDNIASRGKLTGDDVILIAAPIGHMIGFAAGLLLSVRLGATMVLQEAWNGKRGVELIVQEGVSYSAGAAPYLSDICEVSATATARPTGLRLFLCAGAPIPPALIERAGRELNLRVTSVWGMTETLANTMTEPEFAFDKSAKTDGRPLDGSEVKVVDSDGRRLKNGEIGRLMVRGAQMLIGYYKRPDIELFDSEGWMDTGDLAYMDDEGYIRIAGRTKDIIIRGGDNVPVADVENVLYEHPALLAVAVVGYPDARLGERACAFVQTRPGQTFGLADLQAHMAAKKVAKQFWPERVEVVETMPRTPSGKIQKFALRDTAKRFGS